MERRKRLLIVDDESDVNLTLKLVLEEKEFEVITFTDPFLALDDFRKGLYDLLILDIKMSKMDGFEFYRKIKKIDNKVKVCFLTAVETNCIIPEDILAENQIIRKPIENKELLYKINQILSYQNI